MKDINLTIVITTSCNLKCKYCINESGSELKRFSDFSTKTEWDSSKEIVDILIRISKKRNIRFIKFFGGEPLLRDDFIKEIIEKNNLYGGTKHQVKFAMTINAYKEIDNELLKFFKKNRVILNVSLDGPEEINNQSRIAKDEGNTYFEIMKNIKKIKDMDYPFALISVIDERLITNEYSIIELSEFMSKITDVYKLEPVYKLFTEDKKVENEDILFRQLYEFIEKVFNGIKSLNENNYIYENNVYRTIVNIFEENKKEYVCSAHDFLALYPSRVAYKCYNLDNEEYLISNDLLHDDIKDIDNKLEQYKEKLKIENFPQEYKNIEYYGDYCPKDNNFDSFAYKYRKKMVDKISEELERIELMSPSHMSLLNYVVVGKKSSYMENIN